MKFREILGMALLFILGSCTKHDSAGNTIETENNMAILVFDQNGKPAVNVRTEIRPVWYLADTAKTTDTSLVIRNIYTDKNGWVNCRDLPLGRYVINVSGDSLGSFAEINHLDTSAGTEQLKMIQSRLGSVQGFVALPKGVHHAWIQVYGLEKKVKTDSLGSFRLTQLPPGALRVRAISFDVPSALAEDVIQVRPEYTMNAGVLAVPSLDAEDLATWRHLRRFKIDSLISSWMRPVYGSTVVTLKLDSTNFNFSEAMADGRDLRILDEKGNFVAIQRARWDSDLQKAVIRIHVATTNLDTSTQFTLLWGHEGAVDPSYSELWKGIGDSLKYELYTIPVADFENIKTTQTALPSPIPATYWYVTPYDTSVKLDSALKADFTTAFQSAGGGRSGHAMHISYTASTSLWVIIGTALGPSHRSLATLDSIVFWVRGTGRYSFILENLGDAGGKALFIENLDTLWTKKCIRPIDFMTADSIGGNIGWDNVKDSITNLTFFAGNGTDLWIDDIRMYGVNRDDLK